MAQFENLERLLIQIGEKARDAYKNKLRQSNTYASGKLYNSIDYKIETTNTSVKLYLVAENYWINIEEGRKAGSKMPPISMIRKWMISRGIPDNKGTAYIISKRISQRGIRPKPFVREIKDGLNIYMSQIETAIRADITQQLTINTNGNNNII